MDLLNLFVKIGVKDEASAAVDDVSGNIIGKLASAAKTAAKALAGMWAVKKVAEFGKAAFDAYAEYEQLVGGVDKLFGDASGKLQQYAQQAYATAGMSANEYMQQTTSFSAALINSLGGDTAKAADQADVAMRAISDNVNTFGSDMESVTGAFQGFAKGQYNMLDNLRLGYGGTKTEMERLIADANEYAAANGKAADLSIDSFSDIVTAIELIQEKQGIAGTTAREALGTIEGSLNMTKAAWQNLVTEFGKPDADIGARISDMFTALMGEGGEGGLVRNVVNEVGVIATNIINAVSSAISAGIGYIATNGPQMVSNAMQSIGSALGDAVANLMSFNDKGFDSWFANLLGSGKDMADTVANFVKGIGDSIANNWPTIQANISALWDEAVSFVQTHGPQILSAIGNVLGSIGGAILEHGPELLGAAAEALGSLMEWVTSNGPTLVNTAVSVIGNLIDTAKNWLIENGPSILEAKTAFGNIVTAIVEHGPEILSNIGNTIGLVIGYIIDAAPKMLAAAAEFMGGLITGTSKEGETLHKWFADFFPDGLLKGLGDIGKMLLDTGKSLINGLLDGIGEVAPDVEEAIRGAFDKVLEFFGAIGDFLTDPVGSIKAGFDVLMGSGEDAEASTADSMAKVQGNIEGAMFASAGAVDSYNETPLNNKTATASVKGNATDGKAKSGVDSTKSAVNSMNSKSVTAKATGNATDGKAKGAIDNTKGAVDRLSGKSISVSASGNVITGAAQSMVSGMKSWLSGLRDKTFTVTQKTVKKGGGAWGGITPRYHATGGVRVADRYGEGVPLNVVGERGPEAIVPLTSHYGKDFARMMGEEASKHMGSGDINIYLEYNAGEDARAIVGDMASELELLGIAGGTRWR